MDREALLKRVAPCGLVCWTCAAAKDGIIQRRGRALRRYVEGFDPYAEKLSEFEPRLKKFPEFKAVLELIGEASCEGCRDGVCKVPGCGIAPCAKDKDVDFCFECESFPCEKADFDPLLKAKWLAANERMQEIGVETYFEEVKDSSHYS